MTYRLLLFDALSVFQKIKKISNIIHVVNNFPNLNIKEPNKMKGH